MNCPDGRSGLLDFAERFIRGIDHHSEVRTEQLAEAFRQCFGLPPFPSFDDIWQLGDRLGVQMTRPPTMPLALPGANLWHGDSSPTILVSPDLSLRYAETTLGHELREVIETAFKRVKPSYQGLNTADNRTMNPESDQFAGCLLMQAEASRLRLRQSGFDFSIFARSLGRSLSSLILRSRQLFPAERSKDGPVAGLWLFEAPWSLVEAGDASPDQMKVKYHAHLSGFSTRKRGSPEQLVARRAFPARGHSAVQCRIAVQAIEEHRPVIGYLPGFDLFQERDFIVAAEPFFANGCPWRVLLAAVRRDFEAQVRPWIGRLGRGLPLPAFWTI